MSNNGRRAEVAAHPFDQTLVDAGIYRFVDDEKNVDSMGRRNIEILPEDQQRRVITVKTGKEYWEVMNDIDQKGGTDAGGGMRPLVYLPLPDYDPSDKKAKRAAFDRWNGQISGEHWQEVFRILSEAKVRQMSPDKQGRTPRQQVMVAYELANQTQEVVRGIRRGDKDAPRRFDRMADLRKRCADAGINPGWGEVALRVLETEEHMANGFAESRRRIGEERARVDQLKQEFSSVIEQFGNALMEAKRDGLIGNGNLINLGNMVETERQILIERKGNAGVSLDERNKKREEIQGRIDTRRGEFMSQPRTNEDREILARLRR